MTNCLKCHRNLFPLLAIAFFAAPGCVKSRAPTVGHNPTPPLPAATPDSALTSAFHPATPFEIKDFPVLDSASCHIPDEFYPRELSKQSIEGDTVLRVDISEQAKVVGVRVIRGPNKMLDDIASAWMKTRCRVLSPARNHNGQAVSSVIPFIVHWQISRQRPD